MGDREKRSRNYQRQRHRQRGEEGPFRDKLKKPTILSRPKTESEGERNEFPTLLQANAPVKPEPVEAEPRKTEVKPFVVRGPLDSLELSPSPERRVCLVDDKMVLHGDMAKFLSDENSDFLVVGVIGPQSAGKSTIINDLAESKVFRVSTKENQLNGEHCTQGIDAWISSERTIFLDCQPVINAPSLIKSSRRGGDGEYPSSYFSRVIADSKKDCMIDTDSTRLTTFLMSVCHCLVLVLDYALDPDVLHFLLIAEMLKSHSPSQDADTMTDYYPSLIVVHNKCRMEDSTPKFFKTLSEFYELVFDRTAFKVRDGISASDHPDFRQEIPPEINPEEEAYEEFSLPPDVLRNRKDSEPPPPKLNLYLFPDTNVSDNSFKDLMKLFRRSVLSYRPRQLTNKTLTEAGWFHYASQTWNTAASNELALHPGLHKLVQLN